MTDIIQEAASRRANVIKAALDKLNHANDDHWTPEGEPRLAMLAEFCGFMPRREEIKQFNCTRRPPAADDVQSAPATTHDDPPEMTGSGKPAVNVIGPREHPRISVERASADLEAAEVARLEAAERVRLAHANVRTTRARLAEALKAFEAVFPPLTPLENVRQYLAASQERKRQLAAGEAEPTAVERVGNSYLDRSVQRYGGADAFARKTHRTGHRRGALPSSMHGAKLPSQR
jgi:hypothetical protein